MRSWSKFAVLALAGLALACGPQGESQNADAKVAKAGPGKVDWTRVVTTTPEGGYRMGNPAAKAQLVEYGSFTCPHCAEFHAKGAPEVKKLVAAGNLSFEFRSFLLGAADVPVSLLAYCQPAGAFFAVTDAVYDSQEQWMGKVRAAPQAELQRLSNMPPEQMFPAYLTLTGLDNLFRLRGLTAAKQSQCLADKAKLDLLAKVRNEAVAEHKLTGTPTFLLNGETLENVYDWPSLEPKLKGML